MKTLKANVLAALGTLGIFACFVGVCWLVLLYPRLAAAVGFAMLSGPFIGLACLAVFVTLRHKFARWV